MDKQWYAVRTFNGYEHKVAENLQKQINQENMGNLITEIYVPVIERYTFVRSKLKKKEELLFWSMKVVLLPLKLCLEPFKIGIEAWLLEEEPLVKASFNVRLPWLTEVN